MRSGWRIGTNAADQADMSAERSIHFILSLSVRLENLRSQALHLQGSNKWKIKAVDSKMLHLNSFEKSRGKRKGIERERRQNHNADEFRKLT